MKREHYGLLPQSPLKPGTACYLPEVILPARVRLESPAIEVMTDLRRVGSITVAPDVAVADAEQSMKRHGVRALMVVDALHRMLGIVTATDILGEKPLKLVHERGYRHAELAVRDVMTPAERIDVIAMNDVLHAEVGHVLATLKHSARQHALVVDQEADGRWMVRGMFSSTQIARQLGITLHSAEVGRSFAEIGAAIGH